MIRLACAVRIEALDVLPVALAGLLRNPTACWLCSTEEQEVQVWPLSTTFVPDPPGGPSGGRSGMTPPLAHLRLEHEQLARTAPSEPW